MNSNIEEVRAVQAATGVEPVAHALRFNSLFHPGRAVVVPCDADGVVDMDRLSERLRNGYLGARALVGREYAYPTLEPLH